MSCAAITYSKLIIEIRLWGNILVFQICKSFHSKGLDNMYKVGKARLVGQDKAGDKAMLVGQGKVITS